MRESDCIRNSYYKMRVTIVRELYIIARIMSYQEIVYGVAEQVATITLNRPDRLNAWTARMENEVRLAMDDAERDSSVRAIVLTGAGRGFCAGADMSLLSAVAEHGLVD